MGIGFTVAISQAQPGNGVVDVLLSDFGGEGVDAHHYMSMLFLCLSIAGVAIIVDAASIEKARVMGSMPSKYAAPWRLDMSRRLVYAFTVSSKRERLWRPPVKRQMPCASVISRVMLAARNNRHINKYYYEIFFTPMWLAGGPVKASAWK